MVKPSEPNYSKKYHLKKLHIIEEPFTRSNWYRHVNWLNVTFIVGLLMYGLIAAYWTPLQLKTAAWAIAYYFITSLGITAGTLYLQKSESRAHTSYSARLPLKIFLAAADHRAHHRYTNTDKDPYSVRKGLLYSHFGWMIIKQNPKRIGRTDISDLNDDPVVVWQHRNYIKTIIFMGMILPCLVTGLGWGDWMGGFIYAGIVRIFFVQQATFCVNSLAHWLGDHIFTALVTLSEGYYNFYYEFPLDYRNFIEYLIIIAIVVYDVSDFIKNHLGGKALITSSVSEDITAIFNGGIYNHFNAAHNLLSIIRVGVLRGGYEVEIWKRETAESASQKIIQAGNEVIRSAGPVAFADGA
ncbi:hypothetical protein DL98DRAFT_638411 [Cadophora sp. DSE1049]|nr:hypothetical protein DL98DRAFT_638411 [Cadophora sp. DSE1049]